MKQPNDDLLMAIRELSAKVDRLERASRMPHIPPATMATALLLTGVTSRTDIARHIGVNRVTIQRSASFAAFRLAEGGLRSRSATSRRRRAGGEFTEDAGE